MQTCRLDCCFISHVAIISFIIYHFFGVLNKFVISTSTAVSFPTIDYLCWFAFQVLF